MIDLPSEKILIEHVKSALDEVAGWDEARRNQNRGWANSIGRALRERLEAPGVECCYEQNVTIPRDQREWLFDFCALLYEKPRGVRRFVAQAAIIGEIEFARVQGALDDDFEKLLVVDSLVCFFVFRKWSKIDAQSALDEFFQLAEKRREYAKRRGTPPCFVLSCYLEPEHRFMHRVVGEPQA
jgi:hypothetical protein